MGGSCKSGICTDFANDYFDCIKGWFRNGANIRIGLISRIT